MAVLQSRSVSSGNLDFIRSPPATSMSKITPNAQIRSISLF
jgi:hypothetical protein